MSKPSRFVFSFISWDGKKPRQYRKGPQLPTRPGARVRSVEYKIEYLEDQLAERTLIVKKTPTVDGRPVQTGDREGVCSF